MALFDILVSGVVMEKYFHLPMTMSLMPPPPANCHWLDILSAVAFVLHNFHRKIPVFADDSPNTHITSLPPCPTTVWHCMASGFVLLAELPQRISVQLLSQTSDEAKYNPASIKTTPTTTTLTRTFARILLVSWLWSLPLSCWAGGQTTKDGWVGGSLVQWRCCPQHLSLPTPPSSSWLRCQCNNY